jgi:hypothetical protein
VIVHYGFKDPAIRRALAMRAKPTFATNNVRPMRPGGCSGSSADTELHARALRSYIASMTFEVFFRWIAWLLIVALAVFTLSPIELRPVSGAPANLERFVAFVVTGAAFGLGYPTRRLGFLILLIGIAGLLEAAQNYVPSRHGRLPDGLVKVSGALLGAAASMFVGRPLQNRSTLPPVP